MAEADVLYVPQLAAKLGRTEAAIRSGVSRSAAWIPPRLDMGGRLAWRRETVDQWLAKREKKGNTQ